MAPNSIKIAIFYNEVVSELEHHVG